ncbi:hypothetical protein DQ04_01171100 [Trypanosoma grayi]|uniref:hypothetical protein n=1 Tax=Trypanosoma grayi TaxID=71804 RepID=UPI0004F402D5|nr:hypothetical protein DQ04_01171100 [Trypanosoma grayi]KEG13177.1 hypothetical protein DQ04_01171100 [Trypanosoma grayi]
MNPNTHEVNNEICVERLATSAGQKRLSEPKRFGLLVAGAFAAICASTSYAFNLFSGSMQSKYNFTQREMSSINTVGMVFCYFLLPYAAIYDHFGPRPVYALACVLFPIGAVLMGLSFGDVIQGTAVRFCVYNALLSLGSQLFDLASIVTLLSVFPTNRGGVVAFLKTLMGLGSAIVGALYFGFFNEHPDYYFYFLIGLVLCVGTVVIIFVRLPSYHLTGYEQNHLSIEEKERRMARKAVYLRQKAPLWRFFYGLAVIIVLIIFLPLQSALVAYLQLGRPYQTAFAAVTVVITLLLPLMAVPWDYMDRRWVKQEEQSQSNDECDIEHDMDREADAIQHDKSPFESPRKVESVETDVDYIAPQYQTTFLQSVCTPGLWAFFWTFFCGVGSEFVIIFNARFILGALSESRVDDSMGTLLTIINGVGSAVGRLMMSYFEIWSQKRKAEDRVPITISLFVPTVAIIVALVLFLVLPSSVALLAFALAAIGNGFCASVSILVVRTIYAKDPAKHYNFAFNALWISALLLNRLLYGEWYAHEAEKQGGVLCFGKSCVLMPMVVMIGLNVTGFVANVYLHVIYSRFSQKVLAERRRVKQQEALEPFPDPGAQI